MPVLLVQEAIMLTLGFVIGWKLNGKKHDIMSKFSKREKR